MAENARLHGVVDQLRAEISRNQAALQHLEEFKSYYTERIKSRFIVELDYPYSPRAMDFSSRAGNPWEHILFARQKEFKDLLASFCDLTSSLHVIPRDETDDPQQPYWSNSWLPILDGISIYGLLAKNNPRLYLEVGSGNSTKFARRAIRDLRLQTKIISIDPMPRAEIDKICDEVVRSGLQDADLSLFDRLEPNDVVFIDNSHRSFQNSDVTVFFTQVLPTLCSGCIYGLHDIFLPKDYPAQWADRYYNEQYLLMMYLLGGGMKDDIVLPVAYIADHKDLLSAIDPILKSGPLTGIRPIGGAFWMKKC
ncbi:class I SAM-dependent methyltransferase [Phyllobacterium bourgognense]|uniref:class I SAM-dependent methyltransferase n=1 Tax=Phyllobacterium bourgognense TaxID=314236 RepID=UPI001FE089D4|nr:class I SAM-dependent methyltransferase [Phyllobacterium bourgognense]